jgi:hypothetical protein
MRGNGHHGGECVSFTVDINGRCFLSCDSVGCTLCEGFRLRFHLDCLLGQLKTCHLVLVYSTNLFGCRNFMLCPVCVVMLRYVRCV